jgi:hypothetical protein
MIESVSSQAGVIWQPAVRLWDKTSNFLTEFQNLAELTECVRKDGGCEMISADLSTQSADACFRLVEGLGLPRAGVAFATF